MPGCWCPSWLVPGSLCYFGGPFTGWTVQSLWRLRWRPGKHLLSIGGNLTHNISINDKEMERPSYMSVFPQTTDWRQVHAGTIIAWVVYFRLCCLPCQGINIWNVMDVAPGSFNYPDLSDLQKSYIVMFAQGVCVRGWGATPNRESLRGIGDLKDQFWGSLGDWFFRRLVPWLLESLVTDSVRLDACSLLSWRGTSKKSDRDALAATIQVQLWAELLRGYIPHSYYGNTGAHFSLIVQAGENEKLCEW